MSSTEDFDENNKENGPKPMKDFKPIKKNPNSADQFWRAHQSGYEERGRMSENQVERVNQHNLAYPKLRDELDKRRSVGKVKTNTSKYSRSANNRKCKVCLKLEKLIRQQNKQNAKSNSNRKNQKKYHKEKSRVKKKTRRTICKQKRPSRIRRCSYYVTVTDKNTGTDYEMNVMNGNLLSNERMILQSHSNNADASKSCSKADNSATNSVNTLNSPNTSEPSMSSFNTFASLGQEPMV